MQRKTERKWAKKAQRAGCAHVLTHMRIFVFAGPSRWHERHEI